ncbi:c-type cytochrome [Marinithermus hydrothermalis]|uniref:Cytochrome c class I n=1 Tax=Marinithermus hydrothermalis (strain DSM 14884 / JCM 11576 / T1) TaxID=869210 RepID=F2NQV4_MARHT|nr:cytochrome c [Marinithermus hydrothermalis]AEB12318.1 cytochrome c class I [Marinithermus hydrothermalis DSM 14884]
MRVWGRTLLVALLLGGLALAQDGLGAQVYQQCAGCHQESGMGLPGIFPPLAGTLPRIAAAEGGRDYLIRVVLFGMMGPIESVNGSYNGQMPAWGGSFDDAQIAAVLNYVLTAWGNDALLPKGWEAIAPEEVQAARVEDLKPQEVLKLRPKVEFGE